eukprot:3685617-Pyramimonas_sp.AAC.1
MAAASAQPLPHLRAVNPFVASVGSIRAAAGRSLKLGLGWDGRAVAMPRAPGPAALGAAAGRQMDHQTILCGISAFAFQGTNAHVTLAEPNQRTSTNRWSTACTHSSNPARTSPHHLRTGDRTGEAAPPRALAVLLVAAAGAPAALDCIVAGHQRHTQPRGALRGARSAPRPSLAGGHARPHRAEPSALSGRRRYLVHMEKLVSVEIFYSVGRKENAATVRNNLPAPFWMSSVADLKNILPAEFARIRVLAYFYKLFFISKSSYTSKFCR